MSVGTKADDLVTHPTQDLINAAIADHVPTADEEAFIAVYWALLLQMQDTGEAPKELLDPELATLIGEMAANYPTFFHADAGGRFVANSLPPPPVYPCTGSCLPSAVSILTSAGGLGNAIKGVLAGVRAATPAGAALRVLTALLSWGSTAANTRAAIKASFGNDSLAVRDAVDDTIFGLAGLAAAGTVGASSVALVTTIYAALRLGDAINAAGMKYNDCIVYQKSSECLCAPIVCPLHLPTCVGGNQITAVTEACVSGSCISSSRVTQVCASPTTCDNAFLDCACPGAQQLCGTVCCPEGKVCQDPASSKCSICKATELECGTSCCAGGESCVGGKCEPPDAGTDPCAVIAPTQQCLLCNGKKGLTPLGATCCSNASMAVSFSPPVGLLDWSDGASTYCSAGSTCRALTSKSVPSITAFCVGNDEWWQAPCYSGGAGICTNGASIDCATFMQIGSGLCYLLE